MQLSDDQKALASLIELLVIRSGVSQSELARRMGIKQQSLNQYLNQKRRNPTIGWLCRLATACGATVAIDLPRRDHDSD